MTDPTQTTTNEQALPASAPSAGRWTLAIVAIGVAIATTILVLVVLAGLGGSSSIVARWVPADTTAYAELRPDLPGDQESNLASFLAHFPGFDDTTRLPDKLAELADRLIGAESDGRLDYSTQIAPWFGGQLGLAGHGDALAGPRDSGLLVATVTDPAKATEWAATNVTGPAADSEPYKGVTITLGDGGRAAWAVTGGVLLVGDPGSVRAAIDTAGSSPFASGGAFTTARREMGGDQVVFWFLDTSAIRTAIDQVPGQLPLPAPGLAEGALPAWAAGGLRFEADAAIGTTIVPHVEAAGLTNAQSTIPSRVPGTTIALLDVHEVGPRIAEAVDALGAGDDASSLEGALRLLGGIDGLVGWISELAVVVDGTAGSPTAGLVATSSDPTASQALFTQLEVAAQLAGADPSTTEVDGTRIVTVEVSRLAGLLGGIEVPGLGGQLPLPGDASLTLSWAVDGDLVIIGTGADFVRSVITTTADASLAANESFKDLIGEAGSSNAALGWVDIAGAVGLADAAGLTDSIDGYATEIAPYVAPLEAALGTFVVGGTVDRSTVVLSVTEPG
jgi:hypothetical protein